MPRAAGLGAACRCGLATVRLCGGGAFRESRERGAQKDWPVHRPYLIWVPWARGGLWAACAHPTKILTVGTQLEYSEFAARMRLRKVLRGPATGTSR
ncbi:hypothetical protein N656DRAFT_778733 [Canariomyces notabilis]|uniref:Uncharacterized protein n=1 Tax=Canariomyces notabilis TaxID=2074819 RepID=A0AAN6TFF9_9PEZI|nr:hypothetical protein N656DRAFT_778733 [Canariomyces arenarius]